MNEGTKALRAVKTWDAWGSALARGGDLAALLAEGSPRVVARKPATRVRVSLQGGGGQLGFELRVDFAGAPGAELELDGAVYSETCLPPADSTSEWTAVQFGRNYVEFKLIHESVPRLLDAVYARSAFMPRLPGLDTVARVTGMNTGLDVRLGAAQRIRFERHYGKDVGVVFGRLGFDLTHASGAPYTEADQIKRENKLGPDAGWPSGVAWRRQDAMILNDVASFGANAKRIFPY